MQLGELAGLKPAGELRDAFGEALVAVCRENPRVVVLDGDLGNSTRTSWVRKEFPGRFHNIGIAEANMIGVGAGMASCGYIPFLTSLASFLFCNAFDQMRLQVAMAGLNVKFAGSHAGLSTNREGPTSMSIEDFALAAALPGFVILVPSDSTSMRKAVRAAVEHVGPAYIRTSREPYPHIYNEQSPFTIGKANTLREGGDVTLIGCGLMVPVCLDAAVLLAREGVQARVLDMHTVSPLDVEALTAAARETGSIVTAEEHLIRGGLGSSVALALAETHPVPMRCIGMKGYAVAGSVAELMDKYGLTAKDVAVAARAAMAAKRR